MISGRYEMAAKRSKQLFQTGDGNSKYVGILQFEQADIGDHSRGLGIITPKTPYRFRNVNV